jgi:hypothetical protein
MVQNREGPSQTEQSAKKALENKDSNLLFKNLADMDTAVKKLSDDSNKNKKPTKTVAFAR